MILNLSQTYGYVIIVAGVIALECIIIGFLMPGRARRKVFTQDFMKANFGQLHQRTFGQEIKAQGYPDMGSGFYSQKLSYQNWWYFNNCQRAHQNFVEWLPSSLTFLLLGGIYFPIISAAFGLAMAIGRLIYAIGYAINGSSGRFIGALVNDLMILGLFILNIISGVYWIIGNQAG